MEEFLHFLVSEMEEPGVISWFHFIALIPIIIAAILVPYFFRNTSEKNYKRILFFTWIALIVLEGSDILPPLKDVGASCYISLKRYSRYEKYPSSLIGFGVSFI